MKVLVSAASKYGSTREIAEEIGRILRERGLEVALASAEEVSSVEDYDAVILGSAVYAGHWLKPARELADREAEAIAGKPVWLFSSGPIGEPPKPEEDPVDVGEIAERTKAREHRVFPGKLDRVRLSFGEKAIVMALRAPEGDFRDWDDVRAWAGAIADALG
jgi:menaquinone-dependent protoporphyrinogen oxidase